MTIPPSTSFLIAQQEIADARSDPLLEPVTFSELDREALTLTVEMKSKIDKEKYILKISFENYNEWPPLFEFVDPATDKEGTKHAYPLCSDSFFHSHPCICNPCSRKSYGSYSGIHEGWNLVGWKENAKIGTLTNLRAILQTIYFRINNKEHYQGRMA